MSITGIAGAIGTGKSFLQLYLALEYAEKREKQLVFNFHLDLKELEIYCKMPKWIDRFPFNFFYDSLSKHIRPSGTSPRYPWILNLIKNGGISFIPNPKNLQALLIPDSVVCLDEAGIYLNSREFANTPKSFLDDLCLSRKGGVDLFWAAQFDEQVDKQFRLLTQYWVHSDGVSVFDKAMKRPRLIYKRYYWFRAADYFYWTKNFRDRSNHFRTRFAYASRYEGSFLSPSDKQLFKVFDSFSPITSDRASSYIRTLEKSDLSSAYYRSVMLGDYARTRDPFSRYYIPYTYIPSPSPPSPALTPSVSAPPFSYTVRTALDICRSRNIKKPPLFKTMDSTQLKNWIDRNK